VPFSEPGLTFAAPPLEKYSTARSLFADLMPTTDGEASSPPGEDNEGSPLGEVVVVRKRTSYAPAFWPSVKLRPPASFESVTIRAGPACVVFAGLIQASIVIAFDRFTASTSFSAGPGEEINVGLLIRRPPPSSH